MAFSTPEPGFSRISLTRSGAVAYQEPVMSVAVALQTLPDSVLPSWVWSVGWAQVREFDLVGAVWRLVGHDRYSAAAMGRRDPADVAAERQADAALVERVSRGDASAQAEFVDRLLPHLRVVARSILHNAADVDDAIQVALMRVLDGLSGFRGDSSLVHWARRIAVHACLRFREQNQRRSRVVELHAEPPAATSHRASPPADMGLPREVSDYVNTLPASQRDALLLRHVLGYSVAEIAELVEAPVDTVKSRLLYARRALRSLLRREAALTPRRKGAPS